MAGSGGDVFGAQLMRAWSEALDTWWDTLLRDSRRLGDLAARLARVDGGPAGPSGPAPVSAEDLAAVLQALDLVRQRLDRLDDQVATLADSLTQVVEHMAAAEAARAGESDDA